MNSLAVSSEPTKILPTKKSKSGIQMLFKNFRKAFINRSDAKASHSSYEKDNDAGSVSDASRKDVSDSSSDAASLKTKSLPKLKEPLTIATLKVDRHKTKNSQSGSSLSTSPGVMKKMFPTDKGPVKLCRICERFVSKNEFEQHSQFCVINHEYKVRMTDSDNNLRKYVAIITIRRKMLKAVRYMLFNNI